MKLYYDQYANAIEFDVGQRARALPKLEKAYLTNSFTIGMDAIELLKFVIRSLPFEGRHKQPRKYNRTCELHEITL